MKRYPLLAVVMVLCLPVSPLWADSPVIKSLSVKDTDIREVLSLLSLQTGVNIVADATVQGKVSVDLHNLPLEEGLAGLLFMHNCNFRKVGGTWLISRNPIPAPPRIEFNEGRLLCEVEGADLPQLLNQIGRAAGINIVAAGNLTGKANLKVSGVTMEEALTAICVAHGAFFRRENGIIVVEKDLPAASQPLIRARKSSTEKRERINLEGGNLNLTDVLQAISGQTGSDIVVFGNVQDRVANVRLTDAGIDEALRLVLSGTRFTFKKDGQRYIVGDPGPNSPSAPLFTRTEVFRISYLKAEELKKVLPKSFLPTNLEVNKEHNSLLFTGTEDELKEMRNIIANLDTPVPQISIEALIVEVNRSLVDNLGTDLTLDRDRFSIGGKDGTISYDGVSSFTRKLLATVTALIEDGRAQVKANPRLTVLNGYEAVINVGKELNYKITTEQGTPGSQYISTRIQTINAGVTLKIIPWTGSAGEITVAIQPEISNISGVTADGLPELSQRRVDTCIRVRDGETISIGGLISNEELSTNTRLPFLGYIPLLGSLFRGSKKTNRESELIVFITPRILTGKPAEAEVKR